MSIGGCGGCAFVLHLVSDWTVSMAKHAMSACCLALQRCGFQYFRCDNRLSPSSTQPMRHDEVLQVTSISDSGLSIGDDRHWTMANPSRQTASFAYTMLTVSRNTRRTHSNMTGKHCHDSRPIQAQDGQRTAKRLRCKGSSPHCISL